MWVWFGGGDLLQSCLSQARLSVPSTPSSSGLPNPANGSAAALALAVRSALRLPTEGSTVTACLWPSHAPLVSLEVRQAFIGLFGDERLERQLRQRARRHDEQRLVLDEVFDAAEQFAIKPMRGGGIERRSPRCLRDFRLKIRFLPVIPALFPAPAPPAAVVEAAAQNGHTLLQRSVPKRRLVQRASFLVSAKTIVSSGIRPY